MRGVQMRSTKKAQTVMGSEQCRALEFPCSQLPRRLSVPIRVAQPPGVSVSFLPNKLPPALGVPIRDDAAS